MIVPKRLKGPRFQPLLWFGWETYLEDPMFLWRQIVCWFRGHNLEKEQTTFEDERRRIDEYFCSRCGIGVEGTHQK